MIPPSLVVFGAKNGLELLMPKIDFLNVQSCLDQVDSLQVRCKNLPSNALLFKKFPRLNWAIAPLPNRILIRKRPEYVINHYVAWLSAYFSKNINYDKISRIDILTEILNLKSLPVESKELVFGKLLLSYEQLLSEDVSYNDFEQMQIKRRLSEVRRISKKFLGPEFYGMSMNMLALLSTFENPEDHAFLRAKIILKEIIKNKQISRSQREIAAYNLGEVELMFN
jgi:hypothetical protein